MPDLPAINRLGYGLDLLAITPLSIKAVDQAILKLYKVIDYDLDKTRPIDIAGTKYDVPNKIDITLDIANHNGAMLTYKSGSEAFSAFQADASLNIKYACVTGGASASYATEKALRQENQHAFYAFNSDMYAASLKNYMDDLNVKALKLGVEDLPRPFNGENKDHEEKYRTFFKIFGTHVVTQCAYGARCQMNVWASNSVSSVNKKFSASVSASYKGVFTSGEFDGSVTSEEQYKEFLSMKSADVAIQGGEIAAGIYFVQNPDKMEAYKAWGDTVKTYPNATSFATMEIWTLLSASLSSELKAAANDIQKAFNHLKYHKEVHETPITLSIESDWAEFGLLTPSAVISKDPDADLPEHTIFRETKVQWGREHSHDYKRQDIRFVVINDGSPIDFYLSHGSDNGPHGKGRVLLVTNQGTYENKEITDNNWNTAWYYQKPVSAKPKPTPSSQSQQREPRTWNATLNAYLHEIGHYKASEP
ncbi:hypothetical protein PQX77_017329 [Marasmius sp. AFHP31]|nr:hypothetical protein PQX77_017329 [Marasmius sp. AFHP31]